VEVATTACERLPEIDNVQMTEVASSSRGPLRHRVSEDARADGERAATLRDTRGVILDLQIYASLEQIYGRLSNKELTRKYSALSRVTPVPIKETR
jgi:hypothetical protein